MKHGYALLLLAAAGLAAFAWSRRAAAGGNGGQGGQGDNPTWWQLAYQDFPTVGSALDAPLDVVSEALGTVKDKLKLWPRPPQELAQLISAAEIRFNIPTDLLAKLLQVESDSWSPDVIDGRRHSPTGAVGIAQILDSTARQPGYGLPSLTINRTGTAPGDARCAPYVAIPWAAQYLRAMYDRTRSWRKACAAYNQGLGTVQVAVRADPVGWVAKLPLEGRKYVARIPDVIGVA